jgi:hypothetical protein
LFYGSGHPFPPNEPRVPFELQWSVSTLAAKIDSGSFPSLDVVEAIKTAMPADWLHAHNLSNDSVRFVFSTSDNDIIEIYKAALYAWGACDVIESSTHADLGGICTASFGSQVGLLPPPFQPFALAGECNEPLNQASVLLRLMQLLACELEFCSASLVLTTSNVFQTIQTVLSIRHLDHVLSTLVSSMFMAAVERSSNIQAWRAFVCHLPPILDHSCRMHLFRLMTRTTIHDLQALRHDRVNNIDRNNLLSWAAGIAAATRGRRNRLMVQFANENGFGEAITSSFFSEVADAFAYADLGMFYVYGDDSPSSASDDAHRQLLASNGLFPQPYCASHPMPATLLHNFNLLGCMMGKALHDGRAFPLRISYALARCLCGQTLQFEDLAAFLPPHMFDLLSSLRNFVAGGGPFPSDAEDLLCFQFNCDVPSHCGSGSRLVACALDLVPNGGSINVCEANARLYLNAFERLFLRDGVALQIQALKDGFYSVISRDSVAVLGASGLLRELCCAEVAPFDEDDVRFGLQPVSGFSINSPQFQWLVSSMLQFNERERATFLRWVKGGPSLPSGFKGLVQSIKVAGMRSTQCAQCLQLSHTLV